MWAVILIFFVAAAAAAPNDLTTFNGLQQRENTLPSTRLGMFQGTKTNIKKHPYIVSIMYEDSLYAAGTIVSDTWVVTITGTLNPGELARFSVVAGSNDGFTGKVFSIKQYIEHENTGVSSFDYAYACIQIRGKFKFNKKIQAVKLPKNPPPNHTTFMVAGYGATIPVEGNDVAAINWIRQGKMKWLDTKICKRMWKQYALRWSERMVCAYNKGKTTLCTGDFGDGFVKDGVFYGQFVGSVGKEGWCNSKALPNILANIAPLSDWIKNITGAQYEDEF